MPESLSIIETGKPDDLKSAGELAERFRNSSIPHFQDTLGWIYYKQDKLTDARYLLEQAAQTFGASTPAGAEVNYHLGMVLVAQKRFTKAREVLEIAANSDVSYKGQEEARKTLSEL